MVPEVVYVTEKAWFDSNHTLEDVAYVILAWFARGGAHHELCTG